MAKICFVTSTLNYGGATKILIEVANYLSRFHDVIILSYSGSSESFYTVDERIRIEPISPTPCRLKGVRLFDQLRIVRKAISQLKPEILIAFGNTEKLMAVGSAIGNKTKVIVSERQDPYNYDSKEKILMKIKYALADGCVFQTEGAAKYFSRKIQEKSVIIPNFIMHEQSPSIPYSKKEKAISFSARFELKQKRQDLMVEAFRIVLKKHPDYKLYFFGDGPDQKTIEELVNNYKIADSVVFCGKVKDVNSVIRNTRVFALTSDYEGIPNALIEAMADGMAVVSTDCSPGGAKLLIRNGENGILVPCGNAELLSEAIIKFIEDEEFAICCGENARKIVVRFSPEDILPLWKQYIDQVLKRRR